MSLFDDEFAAAWEASKTPLDRMYDAWLGEGWEVCPADDLPTVALFDRAGRPFGCSACGRSDLWAMTRYGKWRCSGDHEPVWIGRGYIEQVIEVRPDEVVLREA